MQSSIILTGDVNLLGVEDPAVPFRRVADTLKKADVAFANFECLLYEPPVARVMMPDELSGYEGFYAPPATGPALLHAGFACVGNANNQNYGPEQIMASNACLDQLGIPHVGTGADSAAARAPAIIARNGTRFGFLQRTSQYWPNNHEALEKRAGVAVIKAYTAFQPVYYKDGHLPPNRPGIPPIVLTWCDRDYLDQFKQDVSALKAQSDIVVSSHHMGHKGDILDFQIEIAHAAIDSGADVVIAHAEHYPLAVEIYKGKPIYYGLGSFCFIKSNKRYLKGWVGMMAKVSFDNHQVSKIAFSLVRQNDNTEVIIQPAAQETQAIAEIQAMSKRFKTRLQPAGDEIVVTSA